MHMIPSFFLAKLYVNGSLKNLESGYEFSLKNIINSTWMTGIDPFLAGSSTYGGGVITMFVGEQTSKGSELSTGNKVPVRMGVPITVRVAGENLPEGQQKFSVTATTSEIGRIKFEISDSVS
jgi:hypothetical protein